MIMHSCSTVNRGSYTTGHFIWNLWNFHEIYETSLRKKDWSVGFLKGTVVFDTLLNKMKPWKNTSTSGQGCSRETRMDGMPINSKKRNQTLKIFLKYERAAVKLNLEHRVPEYHQVCSNDDQRLTNDLFTEREYVFPYASRLLNQRTIGPLSLTWVHRICWINTWLYAVEDFTHAKAFGNKIDHVIKMVKINPVSSFEQIG